MPMFPAVQASMRPPLKGIIGPPHVDTANMAAIAMTSAPVQGKSLRNVEAKNMDAYERLEYWGRLGNHLRSG